MVIWNKLDAFDIGFYILEIKSQENYWNLLKLSYINKLV